MMDLFNEKLQGKERDKDTLIAEVYRQIGQLKVDLGWLKKIWSYLIRVGCC
jgi:hypothetical protein